MFDIGWQELFLIAVLALIVVGPKDLPRALKTVMRGVKKIRELATEFQSGVDDMAREADFDGIKKSMEGTDGGDIEKQIKSTLDPDEDFREELNMSNIEDDMDKIARNIEDVSPSVMKGSLQKVEGETLGGIEEPTNVTAPLTKLDEKEKR